MLINKNRLILLVLLSISSCGPGAEEKARLQKAREDSIRMATEMATKLRIENKLVLENDLREKLFTKEGHENRLNYLKADIEVQQDKLNSIKQPQFLRTPEEREEQIRSQVLLIENIQNEISELKTSIGTLDEEIKTLKKKLNSL